ncbi:MAG: sigma-54 dependent transcriptional regulator [Planctomycetia bacterium]|nr:sigma-54 dependent transcriptional regulator [Planctomycetia bacterium]
MERFAPFLLSVWREACRHIEIGEAVAQSAPTLFQRTPINLVLIRRFDAERHTLETIATGVCRPCSPPQQHRHPLTEQQFAAVLAWCARNTLLHGDARRLDELPAGVLPEDLEGEVIIGPLNAEHGPVGLAIFATQAPRHFQDRHLEIVQHLLEPFTAWIENDRRQRELRVLREAAEADNRTLLSKLGRAGITDKIVGENTGLREAMQRVEQVARTDVPVLILGESGSGKEVVARAIHERSNRVKGPFLRVNCGAISPDLIDSELFGHEKGSFTGAAGQRKGWFERADGGTLLLDECGELTPGAQVRLLRVLQDGTFERVGGESQVTVNVRIIAATHRNLEAMTKDGSFRQDLWYRLSVFPMRLPALRERKTDIASMAAHFAQRSAQRLGMPLLALEHDDIERLIAYPWPGNVRELAAVIERAVILGEGRRIDVAKALGNQPTLPDRSLPVVVESPEASQTYPSVPALNGSKFPTLDEAMALHIEAALIRTQGRIEGPFGAARILRINPHTLRGRMRNLGLDWQRFRNPRDGL